MESLDTYKYEPSGKREYLMNWGWHFSKKALQWAASLMRKKNTEGKLVEVKPYTQDEVDELLRKNNVKIENNRGYDAAYVATMIRADMWGSSIEDEIHLCKHIKDVLDDPDGSGDDVFFCWYMKMVKKGVPVLWEEII